MTYLRSWARLFAVGLVGLIAAAGAGCGLISSNVTDFDLTLPDKTFTIDAASWQLAGSNAQALVATSCASQPSACESAVASACESGCSASCDATTHTCDLSLAVSLYQNVDLEMESPELSTLDSEPVIKVSIDSVTYTVTTNTLDVDTPPITIYVAPATVTSATDPMAQAIGTLEAVPATTTITTPQTLTFTAAGEQDLVNIMATFKTPFNVIAGSALVVKDGDPVPTGELEADVHIAAHVGT